MVRCLRNPERLQLLPEPSRLYMHTLRSQPFSFLSSSIIVKHLWSTWKRPSPGPSPQALFTFNAKVTTVTFGLKRYACLDDITKTWCDLKISCDLQVVYIPQEQSCRNIFTILLMVNMLHSELTVEQRIRFVQLLDLGSLDTNAMDTGRRPTDA